MKRYVLEADKFIVEEEFGVSTDAKSLFEPNYNIIPGNTMPLVIQSGNERKIISSSWGLKLKKGDEGIPAISQEEVLESDDLMNLAKNSPCIIPASGFYKWKETVDDPLPFYLRVLPREVMGLAGISASFEDEDGRKVHSFAVITMDANALVEPLDNRMPVILETRDFEKWLSGDAPDMLKTGFSGNHLLPDMSVYRVPELVNDPSNNAKELIQPIPKLRNYDGDDED